MTNMKILYYVPFLLVTACGSNEEHSIADVSPPGWSGGALTLDFKDAVVSQDDHTWSSAREGEVPSTVVLRRDDPGLFVKEVGGNMTIVAFREAVNPVTRVMPNVEEVEEQILGDGYKDVMQIVWTEKGKGVLYHFTPRLVSHRENFIWNAKLVAGVKVSTGCESNVQEEVVPLAPKELKNVTIEFDDSGAIGWDSLFYSSQGKDRSGYWWWRKQMKRECSDIHLGESVAVVQCPYRRSSTFMLELVYRQISPHAAALVMSEDSLGRDDEYKDQYLLVFTAPDKGVAVRTVSNYAGESYVTNIAFRIRKDGEKKQDVRDSSCEPHV